MAVSSNARVALRSPLRAALVAAVVLTTASAALAQDEEPTPLCVMPSGALSVAEALPPNIICRSAFFWGTRGGHEHAHANITQSVLDAAGGLEVCGQSITQTTNDESPYLEELGLISALEGLCVKPQNVRQRQLYRQLYRQLVATALNCALSEAENCDEIVQTTVNVDFSECDQVCTGQAGPTSPSVQKCIEHLRCFNVGGTIVEGGECALGTCAAQPSTFCGADFGACPLINDKHQSCRKFRGNCFKKPLCQEGLEICPDNTLRSSLDACKEALRNDCTIDSCPVIGLAGPEAAATGLRRR